MASLCKARKLLRHSSKYLILCSNEERKSYRFTHICRDRHSKDLMLSGEFYLSKSSGVLLTVLRAKNTGDIFCPGHCWFVKFCFIPWSLDHIYIVVSILFVICYHHWFVLVWSYLVWPNMVKSDFKDSMIKDTCLLPYCDYKRLEWEKSKVRLDFVHWKLIG